MGETTNQIENHIEDTREDLGSNLQELERKVKSVTDWKHYYEKSPMTMIGVAFGAGVLLAAMGGKKHYRSKRRFASSQSHDLSSGMHREKNKVMETWDNIKGALLGVAATRVKDYVGDIVPDFHEHYDRAQQEHGHAQRENHGLDATIPQRSM